MANSLYDFATTEASSSTTGGVNTAEGMDPSAVNDAMRAWKQLQAAWLNDFGGTATVGGTATAVTATLSQGFTAYGTSAGQIKGGTVIALKMTAAATGAATLNINGIGTKAIRKQGDTAIAAGDWEANGTYLFRYDTAYNTAAGAWVLMNPGIGSLSSLYAPTTVGQGQHTIFVPAGAMTPATTNGAARGTGESTTNKVMRSTLDFDASTEEFAQFFVQMPKSWNESTLIAQFIWSHPSTTTNFGVAWGIEAVALADDDALDTAWGTEIATTDTGGTTDDIYITAESSAITVAGSPGNEEFVLFRVTRVVGNGSDTMAVDARLHGVKLHYTTNAATDD